jgi:NAD-dependent SIR2 family protein deacetylase
MQHLIKQAATAIKNADNLLICAGAGMGVDSGMPDFRGNDGFWKAYPPFKRLGLQFREIATPKWFETDPHLAWGFYGHRLNLYRATTPHEGFQILQRFCEGKSHFVFTSNVDGHFQKAGFSSLRIIEFHGSIHHIQPVKYSSHSSAKIWSAESVEVVVSESTFRAADPLPCMPETNDLARPNVLMFSDSKWVSKRTDEQQRRENQWLTGLSGTNVVIEMGAGIAVPSVRYHSEQFVNQFGGTLIRINPREAHGPQGTISLECGALQTLKQIEEAMNS